MGKQFFQMKEFGMVFGDESFTTPVGRLFWLGLVSAKAYKGTVKEGDKAPEPKYEATVAFPKDHPKTATLLAAIKSETDGMVAQYNADIGKKMKLGEVGLLQDGDDMDTEQYPWVKGCWVVTARNKNAVVAVDTAGEGYDVKDLLGGMKGKLAFTVRLSAKGLSYNLKAVQFTEDDGQRFGGGAKTATELFSACSEAEEGTCCAAKAEVTETVATTSAPEPVAPVAAVTTAQPSTASPTPATPAQKGKNAIVNML